MPKTDLPDDLYSSFGAGRLAQHIEAHWRARGYAGIVTERFEIAPGTWGVRSNMVGGWPPKVIRENLLAGTMVVAHDR